MFIPAPEDHRYRQDDVKCNLSSRISVIGSGLSEEALRELVKGEKGLQLVSSGKDGIKVECGSLESSIAFLIKNHARKLHNSELSVSFIK